MVAQTIRRYYYSRTYYYSHWHSNYNCNFKPARHLAAGLVGSLADRAAYGTWSHTQMENLHANNQLQQSSSLTLKEQRVVAQWYVKCIHGM